MNKTIYALSASLGLIFGSAYAQKTGNTTFYQISVYHVKDSVQLNALSAFMKSTGVSDLHSAGFSRVGVFRELRNKDTMALYVIVAAPSLKAFEVSPREIRVGAPGSSVPSYTRLERLYARAFSKFPFIRNSSVARRPQAVYEVRRYESVNELLATQKIKMFDEAGEIELFERLGFKDVFYAKVLASARMPELIYMLAFGDMAEHDRLWKFFGEDPTWKELSSVAEFQNTVSHIDARFLTAENYSEIY